MSSREYQAFPVEALPRPVSNIVGRMAKSIGCDSSLIALPTLTMMAAVIGLGRRVRLKRGWDEPPIIWGAVIAESGSAKTPAFNAATRPVRRAQAKMVADHQGLSEDYERAHQEYQMLLAAWKVEQEGEPPQEPARPFLHRLLVSDVTIEALAPIIQQNPRGVLLLRDELAAWIGGFNKYSAGRGADEASWLSMFNAGEIIVDRKGQPSTLFVPAAGVSICGGIQPDVFKRALGNEHRENGLLARLLVAMPPRKPKKWTDADVSPADEAIMEMIVERLIGLEPLPDGSPVVLELSSEARQAWVAFYDAHNAEQAELSGDLAAAWSKLEAYVPRLALVIQILKWACGEQDDAEPVEIGSESMAAAIVLVRWFGAEAQRVYGFLSETSTESEQQRLVEWILRHGGCVTPSQIKQGHRRFKDVEAVEVELIALVKAGIGKWEVVPSSERGGRPSRRFVIEKPVVDYETKPDRERIDGCVDVDAA